MLDFNGIKNLCLQCNRCDLSKTRRNVVFGNGDINSKIMFVAEAPGEKEDILGKVFMGQAGMLFDKMLASIDLKREDVYISNIVKCHPPKNRDPKPEEKTACLPYLRAQVKFIRPQIIVCLGRVSAQAIISPDFKITRDHGKWIQRAGFFLTATYHPSALLRDPSKKYDSYEDLKIIRKKFDELKND